MYVIDVFEGRGTCGLFRLLTLGVSLLRGKLVVSPLERTVLREKIYNAALDHFW